MSALKKLQLPPRRLAAVEAPPADEHHRLLVERRRDAFQKLTQAIHDFEVAIRTKKVVEAIQDGATRFPQWDRVHTAYMALRLLYVAPRSRSGWRRGADGKPVPERPVTDWLNESARFRDAFYGIPDKNGRRHFDGVPGEIALVVRRYWALRSKWRKKTPAYKKKHAAYMREYMAARRAKAKEASHV